MLPTEGELDKSYNLWSDGCNDLHRDMLKINLPVCQCKPADMIFLEQIWFKNTLQLN
jgi:hypothetical protein